MSATILHALADAVGVARLWRDFENREQCVKDRALVGVLEALGFRATRESDCKDSLVRLSEEQAAPAPLLTVWAGERLTLPRPVRGSWHLELEDGKKRGGVLRDAASLPAIEECGYHLLSIGDDAPVTLAVAPRRAFGPRDLIAPERRRWGVAAQIASLRRSGDGGIGDLTAVAQLARTLASQGADALLLSPMHAGFSAWPQRFAPYSPSSRLLREPLYADPATVFGDSFVAAALAAEGLEHEFAALEANVLIDPASSASAKLRLLRVLHATLDASGHRAAFDRWCAQAGPAARKHACFESLHRRFASGEQAVANWRNWPAAFRDPQHALVAAFEAEHADEIRFGLFQQWLADRSVQDAQRAAREAGMAIGLIADLAVGSDDAGSQSWSRPSSILNGLRIGAPPDALNGHGQDWGLTALCPHAMRREGFTSFLDMLRANLRDVGGLRLDHVFGLQRLWVIPQGASADEGAYLRYSLGDLLRLIALESHRHRALIIGEDLGTIPEGFQQRLTDVGLLGMRVLWFQRDNGYFVEPARWPRGVVAMTGTHDLPTVAGWWQGADLSWRARLDLLDPGQTEEQAQAQRDQDRLALWNAMVHAGVAHGPEPLRESFGEPVHAAAAFIGSTPCELALLPLEDALALPDQPNIPGTVDQHPNWLRRMPVRTEALFADASDRAGLAALDFERKRSES